MYGNAYTHRFNQFDYMTHFAEMWEKHVRRNGCVLCGHETLASSPKSLLCGYGRYLITMYNRVMDRLWESNTYWRSHDGTEPEFVSGIRSWRENRMGLVQLGRGLNRIWNHTRRIAGIKRLFMRSKSPAT